MPRETLNHIRTWVFDLDNTLYPPEARLFDQIETRMTAWVMRVLNVGRDEADRLRKHYWRKYGTTLAGLMREHGVDPGPYLTDVHDIAFSSLEPDPELAAIIAALPGRKIVYTNGSAPYAANVLTARGMAGIMDAVYGVEHADFHPKPDEAAFETVFAHDGFHRSTAAMFEDDARNLKVPFEMGLSTIHVAPTQLGHPYIGHHTTDLKSFLSQLEI